MNEWEKMGKLEKRLGGKEGKINENKEFFKRKIQ